MTLISTWRASISLKFKEVSFEWDGPGVDDIEVGIIGISVTLVSIDRCTSHFSS